jgi:hypothetical protein
MDFRADAPEFAIAAQAGAVGGHTFFTRVVSVIGSRAQAPCGNFSKAKRGILVTT